MALSDETIKEMLRNIELGGASSVENQETHVVLGARNNLSIILNLSSGLPKIRNEAAKRFTLLLSQPEILKPLNPFEIRCCLCRRVISYPCWYWSKRYAVNHFHYFICFDAASPLVPTTKCYKRG